jgi:hypothetical protein
MIGTPNTQTGPGNTPPAAPQPSLSSIFGQSGASGNLSQELFSYLLGGAAPGIAGSGLSAQLGASQMGLAGPALGVSSANAQVGEGYNLANALLGYEGIGLQSQGLASQAGTAAAQQGIEQGQYGVSQTQYPEQAQEATAQYGQARQQLLSQTAASGSSNAPGANTAQNLQQAQYGWNMADIYRNQQLAALGQQSEQVGYQGQQAQFANQQQQLGLAAQGQGLSAQQGISQFAFGLQQLGVQAEPEQFLQGIANPQSQQAQQVAALGSQAALIGGLGPNFLAGIS